MTNLLLILKLFSMFEQQKTYPNLPELDSLIIKSLFNLFEEILYLTIYYMIQF
jgi:hypothetical protein